MSVSQPPTVYISSTAEDLGPYREAARYAVLRAGAQPLLFEYGAAGANPPLEECLRRVEQADLVVVLVAYRYGWVPEGQPAGEEKSITWLECERAAKRGIPVLSYRIDENARWPRELFEEYRIEEAKENEAADLDEIIEEVSHNRQRLMEFKVWLDRFTTCTVFSTLEIFEGELLQELWDWVETGSGKALKTRIGRKHNFPSFLFGAADHFPPERTRPAPSLLLQLDTDPLLHLLFHLTLTGALAPERLLDLEVAAVKQAISSVSAGLERAVDLAGLLEVLERRSGATAVSPLWLAWCDTVQRERVQRLRQALAG